MKKLFFLIIISYNFVFSQKSYMANDHVEYKTTIENDYYNIVYRFKDHLDELVQIKYKFNVNETKKDIAVFGLNNSIFNPYKDLPEVIKKRKKIISDALFQLDGNTINVDKNKVVQRYLSYCKPIARRLVYYLQMENMDTRLNRIELAMRFVQDIPYAIPQDDKNIFYGGVSPIPSLLINGWGDCDSKVFLFVGILAHLIDYKDIRYAGEPGHLYTVIKNESNDIVKIGKTTYFEFENAYYLIAETAGPGRYPFGYAGDKEDRIANIQVVKLKAPKIIAYK